jgi:hypothetical protein
MARWFGTLARFIALLPSVRSSVVSLQGSGGARAACARKGLVLGKLVDLHGMDQSGPEAHGGLVRAGLF